MWALYPRIREIMKLAAKKNNAQFLDLSVIFKEDVDSNINFFDKAHLTVTGQKKVANALAKTVKNLETKKQKYINFSQLREKSIKDILDKNFLGEYKTVEDY